MARPVLTQLDITVLKPSAPPSDLTQLAVANALLEFYSQGATVKTATTIAATGTVDVYDPGEIKKDSLIQVGAGNTPILEVTADPTMFPFGLGARLTVKTAGVPVALPLNTRLLLVTNRPVLYSDPTGRIPLPSCNFQADATGRAQLYIAKQRFDYVIHDPLTVVYDSQSSSTAVNSDKLEWVHTPAAALSAVLVAISYGSLEESELQPVTYGGTSMRLMGGVPGIQVYSLKAPPTGPQTVRVPFLAGSVVNIVGGAIGIRNSDPTKDIDALIVKSETSDTPSVFSAWSNSLGLVVDAVGVRNLTGAEDVIVPASQTNQDRKWKKNITLLPRVLAAASTRPGSSPDPSSAPTMKWEIRLAGALVPRPWGLAAAPIRAPIIRLHVDAMGGTEPSPSWLNARDFATVQAAIDALPAEGGVVYLPAGVYLAAPSLASPFGIRITRDNVTLRGDGVFNTGIFTPHPNFDKDFVTVTAKGCRIENLAIDAGTVVGSASCLVLEGPNVSSCSLESVLLKNARGYGLYVKNITSLLAIGVSSNQNKMSGVKLERSVTALEPWTVTFLGGVKY